MSFLIFHYSFAQMSHKHVTGCVLDIELLFEKKYLQSFLKLFCKYFVFAGPSHHFCVQFPCPLNAHMRLCCERYLRSLDHVIKKEWET